jgi:hypothetical protein
MRIADGIATVWSPALGEMRQRWMTERVLPTAVLIPFAQARVDFFMHPVRSREELRQRVAQLDTWGYDEVIVAYADRADLEVTADLLVGSGY